MLNKYLAKFAILSFIVALGLILLPVRHIARATDFTVTNTNDSGFGSLRQAIIDANNNPGPDTIKFNIQCFTCTIYPDTPLPPLTGGGTTIDGSGFLQWIQIDGIKAGSSNGFEITSANNVIKGLVIKKFQKNGIHISGSDATGNVISDNYIGTDASSTASQGNDSGGVYIGGGAQNNTIENNVISGNGDDGIAIAGSGTMNNTVSGNYIGTTANGTEALGNLGNGVSIKGGAQNNIVGPDNVTVCNADGIYIDGNGTRNNTIRGNYIGTPAGGDFPLGNSGDGVYIRGNAHDNIVGPDNVIAHNGDDGVAVEENTTGITITQNSIYSNVMGIRLNWGANGDIAAPVIVTTTAGSVNIIGTACPNCTVEVFQNSDNNGEGEAYVENTTADTSGNFTITVASLNSLYLTATATDGRGTSEFSTPFLVTVPLAPDAGKVYLPIIIRN